MKKRRFFLPILALLAFFGAISVTSCSSDGGSDEPDLPKVTAYSITFNANDGTENPKTTTQTFTSTTEKTTLTLNTFTREGYRFYGWGTSATATYARYSDGDAAVFTESTTLYALWSEIRDVVITFHANDGSESEATSIQTVESVAYGDEAKLNAASFTRSGYGFLGWSSYSSSSYVNYYDGDSYKIPAAGSAIDLYAIWISEADAVKITYNANDGTATPETATQYIDPNSISWYITLRTNTFEREGYKFLGWATSADATKAAYTDGYSSYSKPSSNVTLYAVWKDSTKYAITFHAGNYSSDETKIQLVTIDTTATDGKTAATLEENTFTKEATTWVSGYNFLGWNTSSAYNSKSEVTYADGANIELTDDIDLYAVWYDKDYSPRITFMANGGTGDAYYQYVQKSYTYTGATKYYYPLRPNKFNPASEDYAFDGWSTSSTSSYATYTDEYKNFYASEDTTLYAVWKFVGDITITYNGNGGTTSSGAATTSETVKANTKTTLAECPFSREGYSFKGWSTYDTATYATYQDEATYTPGSSNVTLYAVWGKYPEITFNGNGGTTSSGATTTTQTIETSDYVTLAENPFTRSGYTFIGWGTSATSTSATYADKYPSYKTTKDVTLYALWRKESITVTYNANGGAGSDVKDTITYTNASSYSNYAVKENPFTYSGYTFAGWSTTQYAAGAIWLDELESDDITEEKAKLTLTDDITYYAVWVKLVNDCVLVLTAKNASTYALVSYTGTSAVVNLDSTQMGNCTISTICEYAFAENTTLKRIYLPKSITDIDVYAFEDCTSLVKAVTAATSKTALGLSYYGNTNLSDVLVYSATYTSGNAWSSDCKTYYGYFGTGTSVELDLDEGKTVAAYSFSGNTTLTSITFKFNKDTTFVANTIDNCSALTKFTLTNDSILGSDTATFNNNAVNNCPALTTFTYNDKANVSYSSSKSASFVNCPN